MAIKLADVIENINSDYAVVNTQKQNILGIYNGAVGTGPSIELYYNSGTKTSLSSDGTAGNPIEVYKDPLSLTAADDLVDVSMALKFHTRKGAIFSVQDEKLNSGSGGPALYLTKQDPSAGTSIDTGRSTIGRFSELVQQFDQYESITGSNAVTEDDTNGENFFLAGYSTADNKMRKITWAELVGGIAAQLNQELVNGGIITEVQAGGTGAVGDFNGDGQVTTADLLIFLGNFGGSGPPPEDAYETNYITFATAGSTSASFTPGVSPAASAGTFALADLSTFNYPTGIATSGESYGFGTITRANNAANFVKLNNMETSGNNITTYWQTRRIRVEMDFTVNFNAGDSVLPLLYVKLTMTDATETTFECLYYMGNSSAAINQLGFYSADFYGTGGGIPYDVDVPLTCWADLGTAQSINHPPATNYENHSSDLEEGFMLDFADDTDYIEDIEMRIYFVSVTASSTVTVNQIRNKIYVQ